MTGMSASLDPMGHQEMLQQSAADRSLTTSTDQSPMLGGAEDLFSSLDTGPSTNLNPTPDSGSDSSGASKRKAGSPSSSSSSRPSPDDKGCRVEKRQRNTEAARRYRQRKVDRVSELEEALQLMTKERDEMKLRVARAEAEADVLRGLVGRR